MVIIVDPSEQQLVRPPRYRGVQFEADLIANLLILPPYEQEAAAMNQLGRRIPGIAFRITPVQMLRGHVDCITQRPVLAEALVHNQARKRIFGVDASDHLCLPLSSTRWSLPMT